MRKNTLLLLYTVPPVSRINGGGTPLLLGLGFIMAPKAPKSPAVTWFSGAKIAGPILEIQRFYGAKMPGPMDPLLDRKPDSHWINIW